MLFYQKKVEDKRENKNFWKCVKKYENWSYFIYPEKICPLAYLWFLEIYLIKKIAFWKIKIDIFVTQW